MKKKWILVLFAFGIVSWAFSLALAEKERKPIQKPKTAAVNSIDEAACFACHQEIQKLMSSGGMRSQ